MFIGEKKVESDSSLCLLRGGVSGRAAGSAGSPGRSDVQAGLGFLEGCGVPGKAGVSVCLG